MKELLNPWEEELDAIRTKLYEETKHLTAEEHTKLVNDRGRKLAEEFGFAIAEPRSVSFKQDKVKIG